MRIIRCKRCGSTELSVNLGLNPNDLRPVRELCLDTFRKNGTDDPQAWCEPCRNHVEIEEAGTDKPTDERGEAVLFDLWREGRQDMFVVYYRCNDRRTGQGLVYTRLLFYAACRAEDWVRSKATIRTILPDPGVEHSFEIYYFNPTVSQRPDRYKRPEDVFELFTEDRHRSFLAPIYLQII